MENVHHSLTVNNSSTWIMANDITLLTASISQAISQFNFLYTLPPKKNCSQQPEKKYPKFLLFPPPNLPAVTKETLHFFSITFSRAVKSKRETHIYIISVTKRLFGRNLDSRQRVAISITDLCPPPWRCIRGGSVTPLPQKKKVRLHSHNNNSAWGTILARRHGYNCNHHAVIRLWLQDFRMDGISKKHNKFSLLLKVWGFSLLKTILKRW